MRNRAFWMVGICLFARTAAAAVPSEFTVQGVLRDSSGDLQSMPVAVEVEFWDGQSAGQKIGATYAQAAVPVANGLFTHTFTLNPADVTALGAAANVWMGVKAGSDDFPRQKVTPELYSLFAKTAEVASSLSSACSGCIDNAMIAPSGIAASKISGTVAAATTASQIAGRTVSGTPSAGQVLTWNAGMSRWEPGASGVTSVASGTGLTGGPITSAGTLSLASVIPGDHYLTDNLYMSVPSPAPNPLAKLIVNAQVGNTAAIFGSTRPIALVQGNPTIGFNSYFNAGWKVLTGGQYAGDFGYDTGTGAFVFNTADNTAAQTGDAVGARTQRLRIENGGGITIPNAAPNHISWATNTGAAVPSATSTGWRLKTWSDGNHGLGVSSGNQWYSAEDNHDFYTVSAGPVWNNIARLAEPGRLIVGDQIASPNAPISCEPFQSISACSGLSLADRKNAATDTAGNTLWAIYPEGDVLRLWKGVGGDVVRFALGGPATHTGTISTSGNTVLGVGTNFTLHLVGNLINAGGQRQVITGVISPTQLTTFGPLPSLSGVSYSITAAIDPDSVGLNQLAFGHIRARATAWEATGFCTGGSTNAAEAVCMGANGGTMHWGYNIGAGVMTATAELQQDGDFNVAGGVGQLSDERLKKNIRPIAKALEAIDRVRGVYFDWKKDGRRSLGVIAQEVEKVFPEVIMTTSAGMKTVDYGKLIAVLIEGVKELRGQVTRLERDNAELRASVAKLGQLQTENAALKTRLDNLERAVERLAMAPARTTRTKLAQK